mmetsp:Transcript_5288/g.7964  ORF Transcript_5288/g.7964 Transcript_5288/m.7964 type:complete len:236 (+) Transcript_5288:56-763(+)
MGHRRPKKTANNVEIKTRNRAPSLKCGCEWRIVLRIESENDGPVMVLKLPSSAHNHELFPTLRGNSPMNGLNLSMGESSAAENIITKKEIVPEIVAEIRKYAHDMEMRVKAIRLEIQRRYFPLREQFDTQAKRFVENTVNLTRNSIRKNLIKLTTEAHATEDLSSKMLGNGTDDMDYWVGSYKLVEQLKQLSNDEGKDLLDRFISDAKEKVKNSQKRQAEVFEEGNYQKRQSMEI